MTRFWNAAFLCSTNRLDGKDEWDFSYTAVFGAIPEGFYTMIHDMKSPLSSVLMGAHILNSGKLSEDKGV